MHDLNAEILNRSLAQDVERRGRRVLLGWTALLLLLLLGSAVAVLAAEETPYGEIPDPFGGDILRVSSVTGPPENEFAVNGRMTGRSAPGASYSSMVFTLQYSLHPQATFGLSAGHFTQDLGLSESGMPLNKRGPSDTRIFLKWRVPGTAGSPLHFGLRPSVRVPTGYDLEAENLLPFTSRTVDLEVMGLVAYETPIVGVYFNPGVSLPGGDWHNELLGGVGLDVRAGLPLGFRLKGEYFTRYDLPDEKLRHEIFGSVVHDIPFGLSLEGGLRRPLLAGANASSEWMLRLGLGQSGGMPPPLPPRRLASRGLRVEVVPVTSRVPDPHRTAPMIQRALARELSTWEGIEASFGGGADYTAVLEVMHVHEGNGRGLSIPKILATPHVSLEVLAELTVNGPNGPVLDRMPINVVTKRGTGMRLLPSGKDEDTWVPTAQSRQALRAEGIADLSALAAEEVARAVTLAEGRN